MEVTMKAQPSTPTQIANNGRLRAITVMFAGLLVLAVAIVGGVFALSQRTPATAITAHGPTNHSLIAHCRACRDEALAAQSNVAAQPVQVAPAGHTTTHTLITNCRACRDEALGAGQASFTMAEGGAMFLPLDDPHQPGPR